MVLIYLKDMYNHESTYMTLNISINVPVAEK